ncbi:dienelactone hydrolase family protein [Mucilaginibacter galii]|uniref:Carboxymethylenebutenolidase n=1 Tax=Mucilaginibacter galii TaxID=2005073 RepID=A0A917N004_9SPHI|nr:dienelactone hydrolase family protein [Mucilaginibacter galii]GGI49263.1 carboxymethylenebutenolidase [Mucilaginibacter galii]
MSINSNYINLEVADGSTMLAYTASPENITAETPAIIVLQEAFGVNGHIRKVAERFAAEGYLAIAPELFHRTAPERTEISYTDFPSAMPHMQALTVDGLTLDVQAAYQWLTQQPVSKENIFSVGYCLGGRVSFLANAVVPLKAAASYYGGGLDELATQAPNLHGRHLFFWGGKDQHIKPENINTIIQAVEDAGKDYVNVKFSYADHGFNCDERASYNETASKEAWALTMAFLK